MMVKVIMAEACPVSYWVVVDGKNFRTGEPLKSKRFGPYPSEREANEAEPNLLSWDDHDHVYHLHIEAQQIHIDPQG
jgi:hypothetical protein